MASVQEHYDSHLAPVYGWMMGDFAAALEAARVELRGAGIGTGEGRDAADLGAGPGAHALALADAGYRVTAIDTCAELLDELAAHAGPRAVRRVHDDLLRAPQHCPGGLDVITCMGDTLTHLASPQAVDGLLDGVAGMLRPGGVFVATFRDYATRPLDGASRFIPVKQDDRRILTCFLEYLAATVMVHDVLYERNDAGWALRVSAYPKLRLVPESLRARLQRRGLTATLAAGARGMVRLTATRS